MKVRVDPPIHRWADALNKPQAVVATGHQALLWHPGILAKLLAVKVAAERYGATPLHVVVDHDVHEALTLEQPRVEGDRLLVDTLRLGEQLPDAPTGFHPSMRLQLKSVRDQRTHDALAAVSGDSLARQLTAALMALIEPVLGRINVMYVSDLPRDERYRQLVDLMIAEARACAEAYNAALAQTSLHDVSRLRLDDDKVELPLWACAWKQPRRRVFASRGLLFDEHERPIDRQAALLPKALLLSAVMRGMLSDLFVHGLGGEIYDQSTERWWRQWRGQSLRPMAIVTADLRLYFDVPLADADDLAHAIWHRHHLQHNPEPARKQPLLAQMATTVQRPQRAGLFQQMHELNERLHARNPQLLRDAERQVQLARLGRANARIAARRDWCVGFYPLELLHALRQAVADTMNP
ncbi:MAG: hypothetical protein IT445_01325 [Phycisphaeraceae bacterium]|nr:hypothetical protein [Phycisphaeraceae bacterium]